MGSATKIQQPLLEVKSLSKVFSRRNANPLVAVNDVSFSLSKGQCLGLVGQSGSGKSTLAKMILRLLDPSSGQIIFDGKDITSAKGKELRRIYQQMQAVFQSPTSSFNPRQTLGSGMTEGLRNAGETVKNAKTRVLELMEWCELPSALYERYPREVSGGQCQRAALVRALATKPSLLVCDEVTSALDVTVQYQIMQLLQQIRNETNLTLLFICHDIALVQLFCDFIMLMKDGKFVERGPADTVLRTPQTDYAKALIAAAS